MFSLRDLIIFLAGAEFFHTISHIILGLYITLPLHTKMGEFTSSTNCWAIAINAIITLLLIIWAVRLSKKNIKN